MHTCRQCTLPSSLACYDPLLAADQEAWQKERQDHSPGEDLAKLDLACKITTKISVNYMYIHSKYTNRLLPRSGGSTHYGISNTGRRDVLDLLTEGVVKTSC